MKNNKTTIIIKIENNKKNLKEYINFILKETDNKVLEELLRLIKIEEEIKNIKKLEIKINKKGNISIATDEYKDNKEKWKITKNNINTAMFLFENGIEYKYYKIAEILEKLPLSEQQIIKNVFKKEELKKIELIQKNLF